MTAPVRVLFCALKEVVLYTKKIQGQDVTYVQSHDYANNMFIVSHVSSYSKLFPKTVSC